MREQKLIGLLQEQPGKWIKVSAVAEMLNCSESLVYKMIRQINAENNGCQVIRDRSRGISLEILDAGRFKRYQSNLENDQVSLFYDPGYRVYLIIHHLLQADGYTTMEQLTAVIPVSKATLIKDLDQVEQQLKTYSLALLRRKHYGMKIEGSERDVRKAYAHYVLYSGNYQLPMDSSEKTHPAIDEEELSVQIRNLMQEKNVSPPDFVFDNIVVHICTLIIRASAGRYLLEDIQTEQAIGPLYQSLANDICFFLSKRYSLEIPDVEKRYLAMVLSAKAGVFSSDSPEGAPAQADIRSILKQLDDEFMTDFEHDEKLAAALGFHTFALLNRLYYNMQMENPLAGDINLKFADLISIAVRFAELLEQSCSFRLSQDEISFVALHFAAYFERRREEIIRRVQRVVILDDSGKGAASLLKLKLENLYANAIVAVISSSRMANILEEPPDLLLTTSAAFDENMVRGIPIIHVNPLPSEEEIGKIRDLAIFHLSENECSASVLQLQPLFKEELFERSDADDYLETIRHMAKRMTETGYAGKDYDRSVIEREKRFTTIYPGGVAGPHAMVMNAARDCIGVTILNRPIHWQDQKVQLIFLINLKKSHLFLHKEVSKLLTRIIEEESAREKLLHCRSYDEFAKEISHLLIK